MSELERRRALLLFYLIRIFGAGMMFTIPSFVPFLREEHGMGLSGVAALECMFGCVAFLMDAPTGRFADLFGRKVSLLIGRVLLAAGCFVYSEATAVWELFAAEIGIAVGLAFSLGADEAFLRSLFSRTEEGSGGFSRALGIAISLDLVSGAMAAYCSPALYAISPERPFTVAAICYLLGAVVTVLMREPARDLEAAHRASVADARKRCVENPVLRELILFQAVIGFFLGGVVLLQEPYLRDVNVSKASDGIIFAAIGLCAGAGTFLAPRIFRGFSLPGLQFSLFGMLALGFLLLGCTSGEHGPMFLLLVALVRGFYPVIIGQPFNAALEEEIRATALSLKSMCFRVGDLSGKTLGLLVAAGFGVRTTLLILGLLALSVLGARFSRHRAARAKM